MHSANEGGAWLPVDPPLDDGVMSPVSALWPCHAMYRLSQWQLDRKYGCCVGILKLLMSAGLCMRTAKVNGCGTLCSLQFVDSLPAAAASTCACSHHLSLIVGSCTGHIFTVSCAPRSASPAKSVYIEYETGCMIKRILCIDLFSMPHLFLCKLQVWCTRHCILSYLQTYKVHSKIEFLYGIVFLLSHVN